MYKKIDFNKIQEEINIAKQAVKDLETIINKQKKGC